MRPRGVGGRAPPATPMSERQQMALLMQMTTQSSQAAPQTAGGAASTTQAGAGGRSPSSRSRDRNERGETPLHLAAIKGDADQVGRLLSHRTDPNVTDFAGWTPLHEACNRGWFEVAFRLVRAGADVNACGFENDTPLHDAAGNGHERIVRMLVERGADVKAKNSKGQTPADVAKPNVVAILKNAAANPTQRGHTHAVHEMRRAAQLNKDSGSSQRVTGRGARDDTKKSDAKKCPPSPCEPAAESSAAGAAKSAAGTTGTTTQSTADDVYEFKSVKETSNSPDPKTSSTDPLEIPTDDAVDPLSIPASQNQLEDMTPASTVPKRPFAELSDPLEDTSGAAASGTADDETRRKKRKDSADSTATTGAGGTKEPKTAVQTGGRGSAGPGKTASGKPGSSGSNKSSAASKSPCPSPKPAAGNNGGAGNNDADNDDRSDLKVPPLKIVIPQGNSSEREETSGARNGKSGAQRSHQALPYVVASSNSNDSSASAADKDGPGSGTASPTDNTKGDDKKDGSGVSGDDQRSTSGHHQRVLRSSNRSGPALTTSQDHAGSNPSPQLSQRSHSPSPSVSPAAPAAAVTTQASSDGQTAPVSTAQTGTTSAKPSVASEAQTTNTTDSTETTSTTTLTTSTTTNTSTTVAPVELHPRKRKLRPSKEQPAASTTQAPAIDTPASGTTGNTGVHPHEQPITNCYQLFLNIRKQIERRRKSLFPVQPKPPQGFKDYLMNRCTYVLAHNAPTQPAIVPPASVPTAMREIYIEQEKERYKLRMQHVIEKEKLVLSVEQEILRVHGLAARTLANQALPFSVCTVLRDEEVYNVITPEQEEKDRNARSRYNGRLFLSWLQDVDDKWEKIKESMLLRHHNEAESLHAVQRMDWEWKLKELSLCEYKATPTIDDLHVPMVHVSDDFDLLPA